MAEFVPPVKGDASHVRKQRNITVALQAIKHGVPVLALGRGKVPIVQAFPRLDTSIPKDEREEIREVFQAEHGRAPLGIGSTLRESHVRAWARNVAGELAIGISPGLAGAVVLDADDVGAAKLRAFLEEHGEPLDLDRTPVTVTGSGGWHVWFANPDGIGCGKFKTLSVDLKGVGGQCVAPGCTIPPALNDDGRPQGDERHYRPLDGTPDLFEAIRAGTLPPYPACMIGLRNEAPQHADNDRDIAAALETLALGPSTTRPDRDVAAMVVEVKTRDDEFRALWDAPGADHSENRWNAARLMLRHYGPKGFDVHDYADTLAMWDGAGTMAEQQGDRKGTYTLRHVAREWMKNRDVARVATGESFGAVLQPADAYARFVDTWLIDGDLDEAAAELKEAVACEVAPDDAGRAKLSTLETLIADAKAHVMREPPAWVDVFDYRTPVAPAPKPRKAAAVYLADLMREPPIALEQIVKGVLTAAEIAVAAGAPGSGKTTGMQHLGLCVAAGADYHGRKTKQGGVLYVGTENRGEDERRLRANLKRHGRDDRLPFRFLPRGVTLYDEQGRPTMDEREIIRLALELERDTGHRCKLVIVDNLRRVIAPGSTSDEANVTVVMKSLERIRDATGAAITIIHHNVRGEARYSGSGAIESHVDSVWQFGPPAKEKGPHGITFGKLRLGDKRQELHFTFAFEIVAHDTDGDPIRTVVAIDVDSTASAMGLVGDDDAPTLEAAPIAAPEVEDGPAERAEMMGQAAREIATTRPLFAARDLYAATNGMRQAAGLKALGATMLDVVRETLISSGALRVEGFGRSRTYAAVS